MSENLVMTFPIKKRISTELFINRRAEVYIQKWRAKLSGEFEEGKSWLQDQQKVGMKTITAGLFEMNYFKW